MNPLADQAALKLTKVWRKTLAANHASAETVAQLPLAIWVLHLWEMRLGNSTLQQPTLQQLCGQDDLSVRLSERWQGFCEQTGGRFLDLMPRLDGADPLFKSILGSLYYPQRDQFSHLSVDILGLLYEQGLARIGRQSRKSHGAYYTPQPIVEYIVRSTVEGKLAEGIPQILDSACGGGAFLLAAHRYLHQYWPKQNWPKQNWPEQAVDLDAGKLLAYVHGVDLDPGSVAVTQISLWLQSIELGAIDQSDASLLKLEQNIRCGNAVIDCSSNGISFWQSAFPAVMAAGGFDLVIGNPPYLDAELMSAEYPDWRTYCAQHYKAAAGNWDLFCIFIEKALQLCCPGGVSSLVVPNKLLSADYAAATREMLSQTQLLSIRDYSDLPIFQAAVYPIVYIARKVIRKPMQNAECYSSERWRYEKMLTLEQVASTSWLQVDPADSRHPWLEASDLMRRLEQLPKLGDLAELSGAATVAEAYLLRGLIQDSSAPAAADLRLVNSGTIDRYRCLWGQKRLRYLGQTYLYPTVAAAQFEQLPPKRLYQARQPKIIVAGMSLRLECLLDQNGGILAGKSTSVIAQAEAIEPRYLLGLLNSRLLSFYLLTRFGGNRLQGGYMRIAAPQLRQLPIVVCDHNQPNQRDQIIDLVEQISNLDQVKDVEKMRDIDRKINSFVYEIYQLSAAEIAQVESQAIPDF